MEVKIDLNNNKDNRTVSNMAFETIKEEESWFFKMKPNMSDAYVKWVKDNDLYNKRSLPDKQLFLDFIKSKWPNMYGSLSLGTSDEDIISLIVESTCTVSEFNDLDLFAKSVSDLFGITERVFQNKNPERDTFDPTELHIEVFSEYAKFISHKYVKSWQVSTLSIASNHMNNVSEFKEFVKSKWPMVYKVLIKDTKTFDEFFSYVKDKSVYDMDSMEEMYEFICDIGLDK